MLKLILKVSGLLALTSSGFSLAEALHNETSVDVQNCPQNFYALPLYPNAKFCQLFDKQLPASLTYFAISNQQTAKAFYLEQLGQAEDEQMLKGRIVLQYANGQKVVIISKDGQGSQIDILIKSSD